MPLLYILLLLLNNPDFVLAANDWVNQYGNLYRSSTDGSTYDDFAIRRVEYGTDQSCPFDYDGNMQLYDQLQIDGPHKDFSCCPFRLMLPPQKVSSLCDENIMSRDVIQKSMEYYEHHFIELHDETEAYECTLYNNTSNNNNMIHSNNVTSQHSFIYDGLLIPSTNDSGPICSLSTLMTNFRNLRGLLPNPNRLQYLLLPNSYYHAFYFQIHNNETIETPTSNYSIYHNNQTTDYHSATLIEKIWAVSNISYLDLPPDLIFLPDAHINSLIYQMYVKYITDNSSSPYYFDNESIHWDMMYVHQPIQYAKTPFRVVFGVSIIAGSITLLLAVGCYFLGTFLGKLYDTYWNDPTNRISGSNNGSTSMTIPSSLTTNMHQSTTKDDVRSITCEDFDTFPRIKYQPHYNYHQRRLFHNPLQIDNQNPNDELKCQCSQIYHEENLMNSNSGLMFQLAAKHHESTPKDNDVSETTDHTNRHHLDDNSNSNIMEICSVCVEDFSMNEEVIMLPRCQHLFHVLCLSMWLLQRKSDFCPLCRIKVLMDDNEVSNHKRILTDTNHVDETINSLS